MTGWSGAMWVAVMKYFSYFVISQVSSTDKLEVKCHSNEKYRLMSVSNGSQNELKGEGL